jgi:hypothetical protein
MDYDPMVMDDAEAMGPVIKISQVCRRRLLLSDRERAVF